MVPHWLFISIFLRIIHTHVHVVHIHVICMCVCVYVRTLARCSVDVKGNDGVHSAFPVFWQKCSVTEKVFCKSPTMQLFPLKSQEIPSQQEKLLNVFDSLQAK